MIYDTKNSIINGLVADFNFAEGGGTSIRDFSRGTIGTFSGTPTWGTSAQYGKYLDFDGGGTQYITSSLAANQTSMDQISIEMLLYPDDTSQYKRPFERNDPGIDKTKFEFDNAWGWVFKASWSTTIGAWSIAKPSTGAWVHVVITYNWSSTSNVPVIYKDKVSQTITNRSTPAGTKQNTGTTFTIGAKTGGGTHSWDGKIAYIRLWNRILTGQEVSYLYYAPYGIYLPNTKTITGIRGSTVFTDTVSPIGLTLTIPSVTTSYAEVVSTSVSPLALTLTIPSVTSSSSTVVTTSATPLGLTLTIPSVTTSYVEVVSTTVSPIQLLLTINTITASSDSLSLSRRRYIDDPFDALIIGHRLPMNVVMASELELPITNMRDGDAVIIRDGVDLKMCIYDDVAGSWNCQTWGTASSGATANTLLLQTGSRLLLQMGDRLLLQ